MILLKVSGCQYDNFVFQSGFNCVNLKYLVVEMCGKSPILFKLPKLRLLWKRLRSSIVSLTPPIEGPLPKYCHGPPEDTIKNDEYLIRSAPCHEKNAIKR